MSYETWDYLPGNFEDFKNHLEDKKTNKTTFVSKKMKLINSQDELLGKPMHLRAKAREVDAAEE